MIKVHPDLCPFTETVHFLLISKFDDEVKNMIISDLDGLELNGKEVYQKYFASYQKFIEVFKNNRKSNEFDDFFMASYEVNDRLFFIGMGDLAKKIQDSPHPIADVEINKKIIDLCVRNLNAVDYFKEIEFEIENPTFEEIFDFLMSVKMADHLKWKLVTIIKNPQKYMNQLIELIQLNLPVFEKAATAIKEELDGYLKNYRDRMKSGSEDPFYKAIGESSTIKNIAPSFASADIQWYGTEYAIYGLLSDIFKDLLSPEENRKQNMLAKFKVLSDASRFEILLTLKESPKYSLEIAELLGLAPSTVSHHMNLLLVNELVRHTISGGKFYYHLEKENFEQLQKNFKHFFLD